MEDIFDVIPEEPEVETDPPEPYHVYVQIDAQGRITAVNSSAFVPAEWGTEIDSGFGDMYQEENKIYSVYMHTNKLNNKKYIGITNQKPEYRWRSDGSGYFRSPHFWSAIKKYGWENFSHTILENNLTREDACIREKYYIKLYNTTNQEYGYNMTLGGDGSCGWHPSEETIKKRSEKLKGKHLTKEHRESIRKAMLGKKVTKETREKLSKSHMGKKLNDHQLKIAIETLKNFTEKQKKKVYCIDENGNRFDFNSISEAADYFNDPILKKNFKSVVKSGKARNGRVWYYKGE